MQLKISQFLRVRVLFLVASYVQLFWDLIDCSPPGFSVHGIFQARILEWVAFSSSRGSSPPSDWTHISSIGFSQLKCSLFPVSFSREEHQPPLSSPPHKELQFVYFQTCLPINRNGNHFFCFVFVGMGEIYWSEVKWKSLSRVQLLLVGQKSSFGFFPVKNFLANPVLYFFRRLSLFENVKYGVQIFWWSFIFKYAPMNF